MTTSPQTATPQTRDPKDMRMGPHRTATMLVFVLSWIAVVAGFYGWRMLHANKADLGTRMQDASDPKTQQDATIELATRMKQHDPETKRWYPTLLTMARGQSVELRAISAWVMANDPKNEDFHQQLLKLTSDSSPSVRANAAVSLTKFDDPVGLQTIRAMLSDPHASSDQQWEGLRALRVIGTKDDLLVAQRFIGSGEDRIRDAAQDAVQDINERTKHPAKSGN